MRFHVGGQEDNDVAPAMAEAGAHGGGQPLVLAVGDNMQKGEALGAGQRFVACAVAGAVVDKHDLAVDLMLGEGTRH